MKTKDITQIALVAAIMCVCGPISLNIGPIPVTLTNLVIYIALYITGMKKTLISYIIYYLLGLVGLPVFSNYGSGIAKVVGPTGGFLAGFIFVILIGGIMMEKTKLRLLHLLGLVVGTWILYLFGTLWYVRGAGGSFAAAFGVCVAPFILVDTVKMLIGMAVGLAVKLRLKKAQIGA